MHIHNILVCCPLRLAGFALAALHDRASENLKGNP
jgi:hypothetical protein